MITTSKIALSNSDISQLKHKLIVEVPEYKKDRYGGYEVVWKEDHYIWASVFLTPVYKSYDKRSDGKTVQYKITTRVNPKLTHQIRLTYYEKKLSIISISEIVKNKNFITILAKEEHGNDH